MRLIVILVPIALASALVGGGCHASSHGVATSVPDPNGCVKASTAQEVWNWGEKAKFEGPTPPFGGVSLKSAKGSYDWDGIKKCNRPDSGRIVGVITVWRSLPSEFLGLKERGDKAYWWIGRLNGATSPTQYLIGRNGIIDGVEFDATEHSDVAYPKNDKEWAEWITTIEGYKAARDPGAKQLISQGTKDPKDWVAIVDDTVATKSKFLKEWIAKLPTVSRPISPMGWIACAQKGCCSVRPQ